MSVELRKTLDMSKKVSNLEKEVEKLSRELTEKQNSIQKMFKLDAELKSCRSEKSKIKEDLNHLRTESVKQLQQVRYFNDRRLLITNEPTKAVRYLWHFYANFQPIVIFLKRYLSGPLDFCSFLLICLSFLWNAEFSLSF